MKKLIPPLIIIGIIILLVASYFLGINQRTKVVNLGLSFTSGHQVLMGSAVKFISAPNLFVSANSTTTGTDVSVSSTVYQLVNTDGIEYGLLCISALGGTSTSTLHIRQMGSYDGTSYFDVGSSTDAFISRPTSTITALSKNFDFVPGVATSSKCQIVDVTGYKYTRFLMAQDNLANDPNDGVIAWVYFNILDEVTR